MQYVPEAISHVTEFSTSSAWKTVQRMRWVVSGSAAMEKDIQTIQYDVRNYLYGYRKYGWKGIVARIEKLHWPEDATLKQVWVQLLELHSGLMDFRPTDEEEQCSLDRALCELRTFCDQLPLVIVEKDGEEEHFDGEHDDDGLRPSWPLTLLITVAVFVLLKVRSK